MQKCKCKKLQIRGENEKRTRRELSRMQWLDRLGYQSPWLALGMAVQG